MSTEKLLALRERPDGVPFMRQTWRNLTFLHWAMDPAEMQERLPDGLTVDTWDGKAYLGLVPFQMCDTQFANGLKIPTAVNFPETNIRTYVIGPDGNPGVWFFSLDAASLLAAIGGRLLYSLPYFHARPHEVDLLGNDIAYSLGRGRFMTAIETQIPSHPQPATPGSLEFWLVERYVLFSQHRGSFWSGRVHHAPYRIAEAIVMPLVKSPQWSIMSNPPDYCHFSDGVTVDVFGLVRC